MTYLQIKVPPRKFPSAGSRAIVSENRQRRHLEARDKVHVRVRQSNRYWKSLSPAHWNILPVKTNPIKLLDQNADARKDSRGAGQAGRPAIRQSLGGMSIFQPSMLQHNSRQLTDYKQRTHSPQPSSQPSSSPNTCALSRHCPCSSRPSSSSAPTSTSTASRPTALV